MRAAPWGGQHGGLTQCPCAVQLLQDPQLEQWGSAVPGVGLWLTPLLSQEMEGPTRGSGTGIGQLRRQLGDITEVGPGGGREGVPAAPGTPGTPVHRAVPQQGPVSPCPGERAAASHPARGRARRLPAAGGAGAAAGQLLRAGPAAQEVAFWGKGMAGLSPAPQGPCPQVAQRQPCVLHQQPSGRHCWWVPHRARPWAGGLYQTLSMAADPAAAGRAEHPSGKRCPAQPRHEHWQPGRLPRAAGTSLQACCWQTL